jgi:hypothetical protein
MRPIFFENLMEASEMVVFSETNSPWFTSLYGTYDAVNALSDCEDIVAEAYANE